MDVERGSKKNKKTRSDQYLKTDTSVKHRQTQQRTLAEGVNLSVSLFGAHGASTSSLGPSRRHIHTHTRTHQRNHSQSWQGLFIIFGKNVEQELNEQTGKGVLSQSSRPGSSLTFTSPSQQTGPKTPAIADKKKGTGG